MTVRRARPAWRGMGLWKWPAIGLILFCLVIITPYARRAGGIGGMKGAVQSSHLGACRLQYTMRPVKESVIVAARLAPDCAVGFAAPNVSIVDASGAVVETQPLRGNPNALKARLRAPADRAGLRLVIEAETVDGRAPRVETLLDPAPPTLN